MIDIQPIEYVIMKKVIFLFVINLCPALVMANTSVGCLDSVVVVQLDIHAESGSPSSQNANISQNQSQNCNGNININNISQIHLGYNGAEQSIDINSYQLSPNTNTDINISLPNIQSSVVIQQEVIVPDSAFVNKD